MNRLDRLLSAALAMLATAHVAAAQPLMGGVEPTTRDEISEAACWRPARRDAMSTGAGARLA